VSIYLDHNATTPVHPDVVEEMSACLAGAPGNPSSRHHFGQEARRLRERARERLAAALGCDPETIVFTSGGTEADNLALLGTLAGSGGGHLITAATEHEAILHTAGRMREEGTDVTVLPVDREGRVDPDELVAALRADTRLVSIMAANNETGVLADLETLGSVCRTRGVRFHTDAVQCFGKSPFRVRDLPVDLASVSAHKIGGPKGVGALVVARGEEPAPRQTGGGQERGLRPGTENLPGIVGFGKAAEIAVSGRLHESERLAGLRDRLEAGVRGIVPGARVNGGGAPRLPNTTNISFPDLDGESLLIALDLEGVAVSTGAACNAGASDPSHVLLAMGCDRAAAAGSIRFSLGRETTEAEIEEVLRILPEVVTRVARAASGTRSPENWSAA
jgi:cysteine desulfurase